MAHLQQCVIVRLKWVSSPLELTFAVTRELFLFCLRWPKRLGATQKRLQAIQVALSILSTQTFMTYNIWAVNVTQKTHYWSDKLMFHDWCPYSKAQGTWGSWDHFKGEWVSFDGSLGGFPPTNTYGTMACVQGHLEILGPMKENNFGSQKLRLENKMFSGAPC